MKTRNPPPRAALALESGLVYFGESFGANVERFGEIVFNTSMTGYQEVLTDPSYKGQIIIMTEPHIGNVGVNSEDAESARIFAEGFVVRESSRISSNWRSRENLSEFLKSRNIPGISGIDTRALTRHIREKGAMRAVLSTSDFDPKSLLKKVKESPEMSGRDLAKEVSCAKSSVWSDGEWQWKNLDGQRLTEAETEPKKELLQVVVMDFGVKHNILRCLAARGCAVTVVPAQATAKEILALNPDGVMLSNGPGDPAAVTYGINAVKNLVELQLQKKIPTLPIFGICLGHQILGHALGGKTFKLKFGHRGANHPVKDLSTGKIEITTQNHGFCVDIDSLPNKDVELTHINLNDQTLEGMRHKRLPVFSVQYHPESSAGPHDSRYLFDRFIESIRSGSQEKVKAGT